MLLKFVLCHKYKLRFEYGWIINCLIQIFLFLMLKFWYIQSFWICTHIVLNFRKWPSFRNENSKLEIIHNRKVNSKKIIVFWKWIFEIKFKIKIPFWKNKSENILKKNSENILEKRLEYIFICTINLFKGIFVFSHWKWCRK